MRRLFKVVLPIVIIAASIFVSRQMIATAPEPKRRAPKPVVPVVEVLVIQQGEYQIKVNSRGIIQPRTQSTLVAEVAGRITYVAPSFRNGGYIALDEVLARIDPTEYQFAITNTEASLLGVMARMTELGITEENLKQSITIETEHLALAKNQHHRHQRLQKTGTVARSMMEQSEREYLLRRASLQALRNNLALIPTQRQILVADRKLKQAQLDSAKLNLDRTQIHAPYAGRVLEKEVDLGQSVSKGTNLGTIYATGLVEIRLPVNDKQAAFLDIPNDHAQEGVTQVTLFTTIGQQSYRWQGRIIRAEGAIDASTRQLFLVAQVDNPDTGSADNTPPLKIGQFVEAEIYGQILADVFILPRKAVRAGDEIFLVTADSRIQRHKLDVIWRDKENVVVRSGLKAGDRLSITAIPYALDGAPVKISDSKD
ncbi:RND efflux system, membrane fusion protein [hydrothermal vent metagenome]|uniref:RND efflux system, membrane fusion protein n=1 Tax=hydrothermal vent metagenome TaxID=652676 RepID=A0A3B1B412_9ZZZZ